MNCMHFFGPYKSHVFYSVEKIQHINVTFEIMIFIYTSNIYILGTCVVEAEDLSAAFEHSRFIVGGLQ